MNALSSQSSQQVDWVINYLEMNSQPSLTNKFRRLRITKTELRIDPAGIVLSIGQATEQGVELRCGPETYFCTINQRGNEMVVKIQRANTSDNIVIVAKRSVCEFDPAISLGHAPHIGTSENALPMRTEPLSFF